VILTEPKAMAVLRQVNPQAQGLVPQSTRDVLDLFTRLGQPEWLAAKKIDRIVLDSFTDLTYSLPAWMKDPSGKEILTKLEIQEFGDLKNYALALVKAIQLTGYPSIIIARSTVKKVGRVEKVVPDGYGKSVEELPGKCLPTVEAVWDEDHGYHISSAPDECSQRCGLPWVPQIWTGAALEFLERVATPSGAQQRPAPLTEKETSEALSQMMEASRAAKARPVSAGAAAFADAVADGPATCSPEDCVEITDLAIRNKVNLDQLGAYMASKGYMLRAKDWTSITPEGHEKALLHLQDDRKRRALVAYLDSHFPAQAA
jgi:hypothetical protein